MTSIKIITKYTLISAALIIGSIFGYLKTNFEILNVEYKKYPYFYSKNTFEAVFNFGVYAENLDWILLSRWKKDSTDEIVFNNLFIDNNKKGKFEFINFLYEMDNQIFQNKLHKHIKNINFDDKKYILVNKNYYKDKYLDILNFTIFI